MVVWGQCENSIGYLKYKKIKTVFTCNPALLNLKD